MITISLQKPSIVRKPSGFERFYEYHDSKDTWMSYPSQIEPVMAHTSCLINKLLDLMLIVWDVSDYFFGDRKPVSSEILKRVSEFDRRLKRWSENVPECIDSNNAPTPGVLDMQ